MIVYILLVSNGEKSPDEWEEHIAGVYKDHQQALEAGLYYVNYVNKHGDFRVQPYEVK